MQKPTRRAEMGLAALTLACAAVVTPALGQDGGFDKAPYRAAEAAATPAPVSSNVLVFLQPGVDAGTFAAANRLVLVRGLRADPNAFVFSADSPRSAAALAGRQVPGVRWMAVDEMARHVPLFFPNDPYFPRDGGGVGQPGQWHLVNQHVAGRDASLQEAWALEYTGLGVTIGVVDDSIEPDHPDLAPNYVAADSYDFFDDDSDPGPGNTADRHGIAVAGVAAARGGNGIGVTGSAPFAGLAGLRISYGSSPISDYVDATLYHSSGGNTGIDIKNHSYGIPSPYVFSTAESNAMATSAESGTIHVMSAGNERGATSQDSNKKDLQNNVSGIAVAALGNDGLFASYSSFGACIFVTAPSSTNKAGGFGVTTTDRTDLGYNGFPDLHYTDEFGGTSSAAPLVAGVLALARQAQPNLDVRMAKHLLARTSSLIDPGDATATSDGGWKTNGAGFRFNQNYGFGLIDAEALVIEAPKYAGVTPLETYSTGQQDVNAAIPDFNFTGLTRSVGVGADGPLEEVLVSLSISHTYRGDLEAVLQSPMGTSSRVFIRAGNDPGDNINWQFVTNAFWGENPSGTWSLRIFDTLEEDVGFWNSWQLDFRMGTLVAIPEPAGGLFVLGGIGLLLFRRRRIACEAPSSR